MWREELWGQLQRQGASVRATGVRRSILHGLPIVRPVCNCCSAFPPKKGSTFWSSFPTEHCGPCRSAKQGGAWWFCISFSQSHLVLIKHEKHIHPFTWLIPGVILVPVEASTPVVANLWPQGLRSIMFSSWPLYLCGDDMGNCRALLGFEEDSSSASQSRFRLSLAHPCPFKNSLSQLWLRLFVSQIWAMWEEQIVVPLWTGPSGKQDLLPAISVPWSRKEAILVPTRPDPSMPAWWYGRGTGWGTLTSFCDASYGLPVPWPGTLNGREEQSNVGIRPLPILTGLEENAGLEDLKLEQFGGF